MYAFKTNSFLYFKQSYETFFLLLDQIFMQQVENHLWHVTVRLAEWKRSTEECMNSSQNLVRSQKTTTFLVGVFNSSTCVCACEWVADCYYWHLIWRACINQLTFCAVAVLVMSHEWMGLRLVPGADNARHWSSHTNTAPQFASFQGRASWRNVKHPGNSLGALVAQCKSPKFADLRRLMCHKLLSNNWGSNEKKWKNRASCYFKNVG